MKGTADPSAPSASLREKAAYWFAVMRGPDADLHRAEFERWLDCSPLHREAYNRIAETFSLGKMLKGSPHVLLTAPTASSIPDQSRRIALLAAIAAAVVITGLGFAWSRWSTPALPSTRASGEPLDKLTANASQSIRLATRIGEIRSFALSDGSTATLDTDSIVVVNFDPGKRSLTLAKGRARFAVVHDRRAFLVTAGNGTIKAIGTLFDVDLLRNGQVDVRLLTGAIDVTIRPTSALPAQVRRLNAGQGITFGKTDEPVLALANPPDIKWPDGLRVFDGARLDDVLADASRYAKVRLRAEIDVADRRISGTYRIEDTPNLVSNIADVLGLSLITKADEIVFAKDCRTTGEINCRPPS